MNCARWFSRLRRSGHLLLIAMFLTVSAFHPVGAQTLTTGDLAFVSFNADEDGWSIVTFVDIAPDTIIYFSDNEASSTTTFVDSLESSFQWDTGASTIPAGAVVRFSAIDVPTRTVSIGTFTAVNETNPGLSTSNETLYAYLGTSDTQPTTFLTAVSSEGSTFLTPAGLTDGINAVVLTASTDYGEYNGPRSGQASFADYKALVNNSVNWTIDTTNDHSADVPNTTNFTTGAATPAVNLSVSSNTGSEEEQTVITVTVTASSAVTDDQTIDVAVTGANITASDYSLSNSIITIPSGSTTGSVALTVVDDALVEGTETATLTISNPSAGITLGSTTSQDITIIDNDGAPTFDFSAATYSVIEGNTSGFTTSATITIVRTGSTVVTDTVTVQLSDGTATGGATPEASGVDYNNSPIAVTFDPGETSKDVSVFVVGDTTVEADETVNLSLTNPSAGSTVGTTHPTAVLTIQNDDVNPAPDIDVQGKGVRIANGDTTPDSADDTNFGSVTVGSTVTHTFTISNGGTADLTGVAVTVSGSSAFAVTTAPATTTVGAGTTTSFNLRFAPTVPGTVMATVSIASNDPDENPYTFVVAGTAAGQPNVRLFLPLVARGQDDSFIAVEISR